MLSVQNVSKTFHAGTSNEVRALTDVSIDLDDGSFLIISAAGTQSEHHGNKC